MKVKAVDVARALGISKTTVSFVLNNRPGVKEETRQRVLDCIRQMEQGTWNKQKKVCLVGFCGNEMDDHIIHITDRFFKKMMEGIEREFQKKGYTVEMRFVREETENSVEDLVAECNRNGMEGVLLLGTLMKPGHLNAFRKFNMPCVIYDNDFDTVQFDQVLANNTAAIRAAILHLIEQGHRNLLYFSCNDYGILNVRRRNDAAEMMRIECRRRGVRLEIVPYENHSLYLRDKVCGVRKGPDVITGIVCNHGGLFRTIAAELVELGMQIPADISLIGIDPVDNDIPFVPAATYFDMQDDKRGAFSARRLIERMEGKADEFLTIEVAPAFIRGETVKRNMIVFRGERSDQMSDLL